MMLASNSSRPSDEDIKRRQKRRRELLGEKDW